MKYPDIHGENNPMFGKTHSIESRLKIRQSHIGKKAYSNIKIDKVIMLYPDDGDKLIKDNSDWFEGNIHKKIR